MCHLAGKLTLCRKRQFTIYMQQDFCNIKYDVYMKFHANESFLSKIIMAMYLTATNTGIFLDLACRKCLLFELPMQGS